MQPQVVARFGAENAGQTPRRAALRLHSCACWLRPVATKRRGILVWVLGQSSPISLSSHEEGDICSLRFAVRLCNRYASLTDLARSPVRSSAVPRSATDGKKSTSVGVASSVEQSTSMRSCSFRCSGGRDTQFLSRQISEPEIFPTVQEHYRSLSTLTSALLRQTIRRFGNHCLWFQWSAVRKL